MTTSKDLLARVEALEAKLAESEARNKELSDRLSPPAPKPEPAWVRPVGHVLEFDAAGNTRFPTGSSANVDPQQCTVGGAFSAGSASKRRDEKLPPGFWRDATNLIRNSAGEIVSPSQPPPAPVGAGHSRATEQAMIAADRAFAFRPATGES